MAYLLLLISIVSVQVGASIAKGLFHIIGPLATTTLRIGFAAIILGLLWKPWKTRLKWPSYKVLILYGICLGVMNMTFYLSLTRIPLGLCVALEFLGPLTVAIFSSRKKIDFAWAFMASIGIFLIVPLKATSTSLDPLGVFLALVAGTCWGFYIIFAKKAGSLVHGGTATAIGMCVAALVALPFGTIFGHLENLNFYTLCLGIGVAILSSAIPYSLEMSVLKKMPAETFGILMSLEPAIAALAGFFILSEKLSTTQWTAIGCIIVASAGSAMTSKEKTVAAEPVPV